MIFVDVWPSISAAGSVEERRNGPPEGVRGDALDLSPLQHCPETATDVVRRQRRVVAAEEDQVLGVFSRDEYESLSEHLSGKDGTDTVRVAFCVFGWC